MSNFIELTKCDGPDILINMDHISSVTTYGADYTTIRMNNGQTIEVKQNYNIVRKQLERNSNGCCCK